MGSHIPQSSSANHDTSPQLTEKLSGEHRKSFELSPKHCQCFHIDFSENVTIPINKEPASMHWGGCKEENAEHSGLSRCNGTKTYNAYILDDVVHDQAFVKVAIMNIIEKIDFLEGGTPSSSVVTIFVGSIEVWSIFMTQKQAGENPKFFRFWAVLGNFSKFFQHVVSIRYIEYW